MAPSFGFVERRGHEFGGVGGDRRDGRFGGSDGDQAGARAQRRDSRHGRGSGLAPAARNHQHMPVETLIGVSRARGEQPREVAGSVEVQSQWSSSRCDRALRWRLLRVRRSFRTGARGPGRSWARRRSRCSARVTCRPVRQAGGDVHGDHLGQRKPVLISSMSCGVWRRRPGL